jgi:hypothetical protein
VLRKDSLLRLDSNLGGGPHPPVVLTERGQERGTERDLAIAAALALLDAEDHPRTIDVADFQLAHFTASEAGAIQRQQQRAVIEILRARDCTSSGLSTTVSAQATQIRTRKMIRALRGLDYHVELALRPTGE